MPTYDPRSKAVHRQLGYFFVVTLLLVGARTSISRGTTEPARAMQEAGTELRKVWDGVYTDAQAAAGQAVFQTRCDACHGEVIAGDAEFQGPPLKGEKFFENWREDHVGKLVQQDSIQHAASPAVIGRPRVHPRRSAPLEGKWLPFRRDRTDRRFGPNRLDRRERWAETATGQFAGSGRRLHDTGRRRLDAHQIGPTHS